MNRTVQLAPSSIALALVVITSACGGVSSNDADASVDALLQGEDAGDIDASLNPDAEPGLIPSTVFVTSTSQAPAFGSREDGDVICNDLASAAGLSGNYVAWLSVGALGAAARLPSNRSWRRTDGQLVADGLGELTSGTLRVAISLDENGIANESALGVYTGTLANGNAGIGDCDGWTAGSTQSVLAGSQNERDGGWTDNDQNCGRLRSLYCFEI